jgi:hypothetical protein
MTLVSQDADEGVIVAILGQLLGPHGHRHFDTITKSTTVKVILTVCQHVSLNLAVILPSILQTLLGKLTSAGVMAHVQRMQKMLTHNAWAWDSRATETTAVGDDDEESVNSSARVWASSQVFSSHFTTYGNSQSSYSNNFQHHLCLLFVHL